MENFSLLFRSVFFAALTLLSVQRDRAATTLTLDPAKSQITLEGKVVGQNLSEQAPGSLTTTIAGTIDITVDAGQIQIIGATLDPNVNGNWAPGRNNESASPADLAGRASVLGFPVTGALRDLLVTASSTPRALDANGQFDASTIIFAFPASANSALDYDSFITGKDSKKLAGNGTNQTATVGTLVSGANGQTLTLTIDATFYFSLLTDNDSPLRLKGQIVATSGSAPAMPTIGAVEIVNGQFQITVSGATETSVLEASANLRDWASVQTSSAAGPNGTRTYTVPLSGTAQFFRLKQ